jgi:hypothetical protein
VVPTEEGGWLGTGGNETGPVLENGKGTIEVFLQSRAVVRGDTRPLDPLDQQSVTFRDSQAPEKEEIEIAVCN